MSLPDYQSVMLPLLRFAADGKEHRMSEAIGGIARHFGLAEEELRGTRIYDRLWWAKSYMKEARLLEYPQKGSFRITERGSSLLERGLAKIDLSVLRQFPEFLEFEGKTSLVQKRVTSAPAPISDATPTELLESGFAQLRQQIESQLLERVKGCSPGFLEQLVLQLLTKMGYGDSLPDAGKRIGRPGDAGVDVVINEDPLGLETLFVQAKRYTSGSVGRPELQAFAGALQGTNKGIFITTSGFTKDALEYAKTAKIGGKKMILIDGHELARLMYDHGVGVSMEKSKSYVIKPVESGFFNEEGGLLGDE